MKNSASLANKQQPVIAFSIEELSVGGAEHMLMAMANAFAERGWQVHMICLTQAGELASRLDKSIQMHVLDKGRGLDFGLPRRINQCVNEIKPDIINSHLWVANAWTRMSLFFKDVPIVATEHSRDNWKPKLYRWIDKLLARRTYQMVTVSKDTADFYENTIGIDRRLITVINNGVDTAAFAAGCGKQLREAWLAREGSDDELSRQPFLIGTVGRLVSAKNHQRLIDAAVLLIADDTVNKDYDIFVKIVGDGPERPQLQQYIDNLQLGHRITLTGTRHDIPDVLAAFDLFVLSSDREGHPLTALEAQAAGTPVVLTNAGGSKEAVAEADAQVGGVLVHPSTEALSTAMREMIIDPQLRGQRAEFARHFARKNFDKAQMIDQYERLFRNAGN